MLDHAAKRSPFAGHSIGEQSVAQGGVGVRLRASTLGSVVQISTWIGGIEALEAALGAALVASVPAVSGQTRITALGVLMRTGPLEFLLVAEDTSEAFPKLRGCVAAEVGAVTDLSHARCRIQISGPLCRATLSKLFAMDLRETEFPGGEVRMTGTHHVPSILHRVASEAFDMYVFSTYAHDQLATVLDAAREYGVALDVVA